MEINQLIKALQEPGAYGHQPASVSSCQTHISLLFFAGDRVYKVKKPVNMGFLDYRTLEARRHFCHEEVRLNRRLAPDIYLGVCTVIAEPHPPPAVRVVNEQNLHAHYQVGSESIIDYAVEMVRLPANRMLAALLDAGEVDNSMMKAVAHRLANFHARCPTGPGVDEFAAPEALRAQVGEVFAALQRFVPCLFTAQWHTTLKRWCEQFINCADDLLRSRIAAGYVREGHGDLHSENICVLERVGPAADLSPDSIVIYDCIEFTRRFRCRDVLCELAFLAMDLDFRGYRGFSKYLLHEYAARFAQALATHKPLVVDAAEPRLLMFYKVYLALVRAMTAALKSADKAVEVPERRTAAGLARAYSLLAASYVIEPALIIMCGLPGSGKSWMAQALAKPLEALILQSDVIRKNLAGLHPTQRASRHAPYIYQPKYTLETYRIMLESTEDALVDKRGAARNRRSVIADGTFATPALREPFVELAHRLGRPWALVQTVASTQETRRRLDRRLADPAEVSDADWQVYERSRAMWQNPDEVPAEHRVVIHTEDDQNIALSQVFDVLLAQL